MNKKELTVEDVISQLKLFGRNPILINKKIMTLKEFRELTANMSDDLILAIPRGFQGNLLLCNVQEIYNELDLLVIK